ncbi:MAG: dTDP-4-dehydrorhamnose reductase [Candidatus Electrothrix aestuarii]|uniref:dTDP-4-dehydrorhamnose reductase n=1 Tax=Candidatus Electrothrix aestuarii TaxID=3062594 RepID=A0AAU8LQA2_9BACT|nr:dTDP-4-dehydrorhamnose reductase [Candidatus Electrothrix aestuarii]
MNILITGAGGQLGQDCLKIVGDEHAVHGRTSGQLDITQADQVQREIKKLHPDVVINCAAYTAVDKCESEQEACWAVNAQGPAHLAEACVAAGTRLIHISTDYVFSGNKLVPEPYTEQDPVEPLSAYGRSKLAGEQAIAQRMDDFLILRTSWLYGMGGNNFLKTMLRLAMADSERTIRVVDDQYGSLTWTMTLARQIKHLLSSELKGIAHATAEGSSTWYAGAKYFLESMGVNFALEPCTTAEYPTPARRPVNSILENNFLKTKQSNLMLDWHQDIDAFVAEYRDELIAQFA